MPEKDPTTYSLLTYAWVALLSVWGGIVNWLRKYRSGTMPAFNLMELIGEIATSAFAGLLTFWLCESAEIQPLWTAAMVGISGHMGSRAIYLIETLLHERLPTLPGERK